MGRWIVGGVALAATLVAGVAVAKAYGPKPPPVALEASVCKQDPVIPKQEGPDCATAVLKCGETVRGYTKGGVQRYDSRFYERNFCWPRTVDHDGGDERVYAIDVPAWTDVYVTLDTPCAPLDLFAMKWSGDTCPNDDSQIRICEGEVRPGGGSGAGPNLLPPSRKRVDFAAQDSPLRWWVVVEGQDDAEGPFALTVQCQ